jgi:hypothetical protein
MDKGRHPQVVRTWKVERIKVLDRAQQPAKVTRAAAKPRRNPRAER